MQKWLLGFVGLLWCGFVQSQKNVSHWRAELLRGDGKNIVFNLQIVQQAGKTVWYVINGAEKIKIDKVRTKGDSVWVDMPVFESAFRIRRVNKQRLEGVWIKEGAVTRLVMPFVAQAGLRERFPEAKTTQHRIAGRWAVKFYRKDGSSRPAMAEFKQTGNSVTGSILTPTGDYRYLAGVIDGDSLRLSTFDGSHAYYFTAAVDNDHTIRSGYFYASATGVEPWEAVRDANASLPDLAAMYLKDGEEKLNFRFRDLNGKWVSINDERFRNKVVIVQIMGSWCPNCMDETAFLSSYYKQNRQRGVEVVGLAYEYSEDWNRSKASVQKFKDRFDVQYPLLITGVTVNDSLRTEKTLPQLTPIRSFPSTIFINKKGAVVKIHAGFAGPGTGQHYENLKKEFNATVDALLKQ